NWAQVKQGIRCKKCRQVTTLRDDGFCSAECLEKYCLGVDTHKEKVKNDIKQRRKCWTCREDNQLLNDDTIQQQLATAIQQIHATTTPGGNDNATLDEGVMESEHDLMSDDDDNVGSDSETDQDNFRAKLMRDRANKARRRKQRDARVYAN
ncbi:hypothetical protein BGX29_004496, partial [Mortierella sp. GBA35]